MSTEDTPTGEAAALILTNAPAANRVARDRRWIDDDGWIDWDRVEADLDHLGYLSGAEYRLVNAAVMLHKADLWGLDSLNGAAVAQAFQIAADGYARNAADAAEAEARYTAGERK